MKILMGIVLIASMSIHLGGMQIESKNYASFARNIRAKKYLHEIKEPVPTEKTVSLLGATLMLIPRRAHSDQQYQNLLVPNSAKISDKKQSSRERFIKQVQKHEQHEMSLSLTKLAD